MISTSAGTQIISTATPLNFEIAGAQANNSAIINLTDTSVTTSGSGTSGVEALTGGTANLSGSTVSTTRANAAALVVNGTGSTATLSGANSFATTNDGSVGLYAQAGGVIAATGPTTISTGNTSGSTGLSAFGVDANGAGSAVNLAATTVTTTGTNAFGFYAVAGGAISAPDAPSITTSGSGSIGLYSSGAGSTITATGASIATSGPTAPAVLADTGGNVTLNGGSLNTAGTAAYAAVAQSGGLVSLNGTTIGTTGNGAGGLGIDGAGSQIDATNVTIATSGAFDPASGQHSYGVFNGPFGSFPTGGVANLTDVSVSTQGVAMYGVVTSTGGVTTILGGSIATAGTNANAILSENGGSTTVGMSGVGATTISTTGAASYAVAATSGGVVNVAGAAIGTTGNGSGGLAVNGAGSQIDATNVSVATKGSFDPVSGQHSYGVYNGPFGSFTTGGVANITNSSISTQGAGMYGVFTSTGGATTLTGTNVTTSGVGALGVFTDNGGTTSVTGGSVTTTGADAHALFVTGAGSMATLNGSSAFNTAGNGSIGLYATGGGVINASGPVTISTSGTTSGGVEANGSGSTATLKGGTTIGLNGSGDFGLLATAGGAISTQGPTSVTVSGPLSTGVQALSASFTASGALNITTSQSSSSAFALSGTSPSIVASGGGTVSAAGNAVDLTNATNAAVSFDHLNISTAGDVIFADPSSATVNFSNTVASAGTGDLLNATAGSAIAFKASASTLTGAIQTDATSTTNVALSGGSLWNMTASSTMSSLNVANSAVVFGAPSVGGFKTLTVGSYFGNGASLTLNTMLGASNSPTDQLIVNGGSASGLTALTIKNAGGAGALTTGAGIPVVVATNGGTTAPGAFQLANTPVVGGFAYSLGRNSVNQDWYLTSSPASTLADVQNSVTALAKSQFAQMVTGRLLSSLLLGATQQISSCDCGGGFGSVGSFGLGANGRWSLSDRLTLLAGFSYDQFSAQGADVTNAPIAAASLRYDLTDWGRSRPFFELGAAIAPYMTVNYSRSYANGFTTSTGDGSTIDRSLSVFGRVGWVDRFTPTDEGAVLVDLVRGWQEDGGYSEPVTAVNPFAATVNSGVDSQYVARFGAQYTHLFYDRIEANVSGALAYGFDNRSGPPST